MPGGRGSTAARLDRTVFSSQGQEASIQNIKPSTVTSGMHGNTQELEQNTNPGKPRSQSTRQLVSSISYSPSLAEDTGFSRNLPGSFCFLAKSRSQGYILRGLHSAVWLAQTLQILHQGTTTALFYGPVAQPALLCTREKQSCSQSSSRRN